MVSTKKKKTIIWASIVIVILTISQLVLVTYLENAVTQVQEEMIFNATAEIGYPAGILVDDRKLNFGRTPPMQHSITEIFVGNDFGEEVLVKVEASGNIAPLLTATPNDFVLKPAETRTIQMTFNASNATEGNYSGKVRVRFYS